MMEYNSEVLKKDRERLEELVTSYKNSILFVQHGVVLETSMVWINWRDSKTPNVSKTPNFLYDLTSGPPKNVWPAPTMDELITWGCKRYPGTIVNLSYDTKSSKYMVTWKAEDTKNSQLFVPISCLGTTPTDAMQKAVVEAIERDPALVVDHSAVAKNTKQLKKETDPDR
jgi:hypothetical protein